MQTTLDRQLITYPTPTNLTYAWSFGSASGVVLAWQVITGLALVTDYVPGNDAAPASLERIIRDGAGGAEMRATHANMPSVLFACLYVHMGRGYLIGQRNSFAWATGWTLYVVLVLSAFLGYVLVWAQMSFWAATVITSLVTIVPAGTQIAGVLWNSVTVDDATLNRFLGWHYALPLVSLALIVVHLVLLHQYGSSSSLGVQVAEKIPFLRYFGIKDAVGFTLAALVSGVIILGLPAALLDAELFSSIQTLSTPAHIVPEWYLCGWYALLRCIPSKLLGCVAAAFGMLLLPAQGLKVDDDESV